MPEIILTNGQVAFVSDEDYDLNAFVWHSTGRYALRNVKLNGKWTTQFMHQIIASRMQFKSRADHINRDGFDNRRRNLRDATQKQNMENSQLRTDNMSGHKGVFWKKDHAKWCAKIVHHGKHIYLGYFEQLDDAIQARYEAEREYFTHGSEISREEAGRTPTPIHARGEESDQGQRSCGCPGGDCP